MADPIEEHTGWQIFQKSTVCVCFSVLPFLKTWLSQSLKLYRLVTSYKVCVCREGVVCKEAKTMHVAMLKTTTCWID